MSSLLIGVLVATLVAAAVAAPADPHPWKTHVGPVSRAFLQLVDSRSHEPYTVGANRWTEPPRRLSPALGPDAEVGFCPYRVDHSVRVTRHVRVIRHICAQRFAPGCVQLYEDAGWLGAEGDGLVEAGCVYVDPHKKSVMSQDDW